ncbi:Scarecrow-like protein 6 [Hirschfeldia incana]|nr:Scarecrow-like protein 6 [Hirschfeldia incana]
MPLPFEEFQGKVISSYFSSSDIEPTSVLSPLTTSSSTVSSSHGVNTAVGGISGGDATTDEQCGQGDWEQVLPPASPTHDHDNDQSILRLIMMGDSQEDPSHELNNILQTSSASQSPVTFHHSDYTPLGNSFGVVDNTAGVFGLNHHSVPPLFQSQVEEKQPLLINQSQTHFTQTPSLFYNHQVAAATLPPPAKRLNQGSIGQGTITEQLFKVAEVIESGGDTCLAQGILARLNQQLSSPVGKPFERAAFYFIEALHNSLLHNNNNATQQPLNPYSLIFKISAYKSFSEISPVLQFANFTSNQALLESFHGSNRLHIIDFDIGFGGQWASLMQELVLRDNSPPLSLKITVFASHDDQHHLELGFTQDNLKHFASEINISLDIQVLSLDLLLSGSLSWPPSSEKEAVAVNLSPSSLPSPLVLRFVKHLSPTIIVCSDRGCERTDLPFPQHLLHSLQSHAALLESLDAVNASLDAMQKIERFLVQPEIEKLVGSRRQVERPMMTWQAMFMQMGFSPVAHSNFTESQAECLVQRTPVRGFHVEKKHNSLLLCWQRRELVGVSAWRCRS